MGIIKKPGQIAPKKTISALIYGQPGIGKTTIGVSAPNAVLFDYDGGVNRINGAHQVPTLQPESWEDTFEALNEIKSELPQTETIVIDTVGKMLDYMTAYIIKNDSKMQQRDGSLSLKGYGQRKQMFINFLKTLSTSGYNVIFVAHEKEEKSDDKTYKRPEIGGSSANDLIKELDLVGYMQAYGKDRTITFDPAEDHYAKNCCNLPPIVKVPVVVDETGNAVGNNNYMGTVINAFRNNQKASAEKTAQYEALIADIDKVLEEVDTVAKLNSSIAKISKMEHLYNSKLVASQKCNAKAKTLGAKYDSSKKKYVTAG